MATDLRNSINNMAAQAAKYVTDAAEMKVETHYVEVGGSDTPKLAASSIVKLDGDSVTTVPLQDTGPEGALEIDLSLFEVHERNVNTAIEYRAKMLASLMETLKSFSGR